MPIDTTLDLVERISCVPDCRVDARLDRRLRALLRQCFDDSFRERRYCFEIPTRRLRIDRGSRVRAERRAHRP